MSPSQHPKPESADGGNPNSAERQARLVMEAVAVLHDRGYGLLKLYCYIKEGIGEWRHWVFASDAFPRGILFWPGTMVEGSIPSWRRFGGMTAEEVAVSMLERAPEVLEAAHGEDIAYVNWYREMLLAYPDGILEMESPYKAKTMQYGEIPLPALKAWEPPVPSPEEMRAAKEASLQRVMQRAREQHAKRHGGQQSSQSSAMPLR